MAEYLTELAQGVVTNAGWREFYFFLASAALFLSLRNRSLTGLVGSGIVSAQWIIFNILWSLEFWSGLGNQLADLAFLSVAFVLWMFVRDRMSGTLCILLAIRIIWHGVFEVCGEEGVWHEQCALAGRLYGEINNALYFGLCVTIIAFEAGIWRASRKTGRQD